VALSEHEMRLLEQMERALLDEDPKLAHTLRGPSRHHSARRRMLVGGIGLLVGIAVMVAGAFWQLTPVGIAGFVIMLVAALFALGGVHMSDEVGQEDEPGHVEHSGRDLNEDDL
jgi:uncharacterized membrane protein YccC